jgi:hypothetical protein
MRYSVLRLLIISSLSLVAEPCWNKAQAVVTIPPTDPDFEIVVFPDTQYYNGQNAYVFQDQANWVVAQKKAGKPIKMVIGVGDIVEGGGNPIDSNGKVLRYCGKAPPSNWQRQWSDAQATVNILTSSGIHYQPTIGNHDYDCQAERPQPRGISNYFYYFGSTTLTYIKDSNGNLTPSFYKKLTIGSTTYMVLSLEFFPRNVVVSAANSIISNFPGPVILVTHAYLSFDGSGPTFGSTFPAGSAYPLCSGKWFPSPVYHCSDNSLGSYNPVGGGLDGTDLWYQLIAKHPNIFMVLSGHIRNPNPGNYPNVPAYNGVGYVNCNMQSWTTLCSNPYRPIQMVSDYQGQGNGGYFGYGYLRILTVSPSKKTVTVSTFSPSIYNFTLSKSWPANFTPGMPYTRIDSHNKFVLKFPNTFGGPNREITYITSPHDGAHVPRTFGISAKAYGPDTVNRIQLFVDGVLYADYRNVNGLPGGTTITLRSSGTHRVAVQAYDSTKAAWVKSVIYVTY